jgi:hypothetical protein
VGFELIDAVGVGRVVVRVCHRAVDDHGVFDLVDEHGPPPLSWVRGQRLVCDGSLGLVEEDFGSAVLPAKRVGVQNASAGRGSGPGPGGADGVRVRGPAHAGDRLASVAARSSGRRILTTSFAVACGQGQSRYSRLFTAKLDTFFLTTRGLDRKRRVGSVSKGISPA